MPLLEQETLAEVVAVFLHVRSSTRSHSSSLARAVPKQKRRILRHMEKDVIQNTK